MAVYSGHALYRTRVALGGKGESTGDNFVKQRGHFFGELLKMPIFNEVT